MNSFCEPALFCEGQVNSSHGDTIFHDGGRIADRAGAGLGERVIETQSDTAVLQRHLDRIGEDDAVALITDVDRGQHIGALADIAVFCDFLEEPDLGVLLTVVVDEILAQAEGERPGIPCAGELDGELAPLAGDPAFENSVGGGSAAEVVLKDEPSFTLFTLIRPLSGGGLAAAYLKRFMPIFSRQAAAASI